MFNIDHSINIFFKSIQSPFLDFSFYTFTWFFNTIPAVILFTIVSFFIYTWSTKKSLIEFWGAIGFSYMLVWAVKVWFNVSRPEFGLITAYGPSFPSAHTAVATTFFLFFLRFMRHEKNVFRRYIHISFCVLAPLMVGLSRLYLGVHWFSDIVAGFGIGIVGLLVSDYIWKKIHTHISFLD
ncbi:MAG: phosphatase PAP2 family protein [Minisyncoccota bacterium]